MKITDLFEKANEQAKTAVKTFKNSDIKISHITIIESENNNLYTAVNWKRINEDFSISETCSEYEAIIKMILAGESKIKTLVTINVNTMMPEDPCEECQNMIVRLCTDNKSCAIITSERTSTELIALNPGLSEFIDELNNIDVSSSIPVPSVNIEPANEFEATPAEPANEFEDTPAEPVNEFEDTPAEPVNEFEATPAENGENKVNSAFNTAELEKMLDDDWGSSETEINSIPSQAMYQQPMNNMQNGMYQQQPMNNMQNGMYQQQPMNNMQNGMYQQQPVNNGTGTSMYMNQLNSGNQNMNQSVYISKMQSPIRSGNLPINQQSVYGSNQNNANNALFKEKLGNILSPKQQAPEKEQIKDDVLQSAKDKKKQAKLMSKKHKEDDFN